MGPTSDNIGLPQQLALTLKARLLVGNSPDHHTEHGLCHNIRHRISNLLVHRRCWARKPDVLNDVYKRICQPRHRGQIPSSRHQPGHRLRLLRSGSAQPDQQREHHIRERDHGQGPPEPTHAQVLLDLTRVPQSNHNRTRHTQLRAQSSCLACRQLHHQDQLDQQQRHGQQPIHVPVGIVERRTRHGDRVGPSHLLHFESLDPRIEDSEIVVRRDPSHNSGDGQGSPIVPRHIRQLQPEEHGRGAHRSDAERQRIVDSAPLPVREITSQGSHGALSRATTT
mmetsp:Transcript_43763/g.92973  ORF Transcript_43763/g.92973 Transcript_43763/m.92973 type:complete len:281 (-) Transcript_43763:9-851(-)